MKSQFAKLLALTTAPLVCGGFATAPDAATRQDGGGAPGSGLLSSARAVSNEELSQMRGGFFIAAGAQFDFGASVQTLVNGKLALLTNVQWTQAGAVTQQLQGLGTTVQAQVADKVATGLANAGIATPSSSVQTGATANSTPATAAPMPATATATSAPTSSAPAAAAPATSLATNAPAATAPALASAPAASAPAAAAPATSLATNSPAAPDTVAAAPAAGLAASAPAASSPAAAAPAAAAAPVTVAANAPAAGGASPMVLTGVQIPGATGGLTQIFANIAGGQIQNVIMNSASGQDITQNTNITMTIYNFAAWQQQVSQNMLSGRLASDMLAASGISGGH